MSKLFLLRHLKSQWNQDDRFAGWVDNPLSKEGVLSAEYLAKTIQASKIDLIYSNRLMRCQETILRIFDHIPEVYPLFIHVDPGKMHTWGNFTSISNSDVPVYVTESLNERYYGKLQGLNKKSVIEKYGEQLVHLWRRGFKIRPPGGESLKDVYGRAVPFFKKHIEKDLAAGKNVLVVASHNSLRALVKYIEHIPDKDIEHVELPFGALAEYEFANGLFALKK